MYTKCLWGKCRKAGIAVCLALLLLFVSGCGCGKERNKETDAAVQIESELGTNAEIGVAVDLEQAPVKASSHTGEWTEEEIEQALEWQEKLNTILISQYQDILTPYQDAEGYVKKEDGQAVLEAVYAYMGQLQAQGHIAYREMNDANVYVKTAVGIGLLFELSLADVMSGDGEIQIYFCEIEELMDEDENLIKWFEGYVPYEYTDCSPASENIVEIVEHIAGITAEGIFVWSGHGNYVEGSGPCLTIGTGYDQALEPAFFFDYLEDRIIGGLCESGGWLYALTPEFFSYYWQEDAMEDVILYFGSCYSGKDDRLANVMISKGARSVFAYSNETYRMYSETMVTTLALMATLEYQEPEYEGGSYKLAWQYTAEDALLAMQEIFGYVDSPLLERESTNNSQLTIYGDAQARLTDSHRLSLEIMNKAGTIIDAQCVVRAHGCDDVLFTMDSKMASYGITMPDLLYDITITAEGYYAVTVPVLVDDREGYNLTQEIVLERDLSLLFAGGSGTEEDPYLVSAKEHLYNMQEACASANGFKGIYIALANDIVIWEDRSGWEIWGEYGSNAYASNWSGIRGFAGTFDGCGYSIYGLRCIGKGSFSGLFASTDGAVIKNVSVRESSFRQEGSTTMIGVIVGKAANTLIQNCHNYGNVHGEGYAGGIAGYVTDSQIVSCSNHGLITYLDKSAECGGIASQAYGTSFRDCQNAGEVKGIAAGTGIAVRAKSCEFQNCSNSGTVTAQSWAAGLAVWATDCVLEHCTHTGELYTPKG